MGFFFVFVAGALIPSFDKAVMKKWGGDRVYTNHCGVSSILLTLERGAFIPITYRQR
jgi:hypothetical protein